MREVRQKLLGINKLEPTSKYRPKMFCRAAREMNNSRPTPLYRHKIVTATESRPWPTNK